MDAERGSFLRLVQPTNVHNEHMPRESAAAKNDISPNGASGPALLIPSQQKTQSLAWMSANNCGLQVTRAWNLSSNLQNRTLILAVSNESEAEREKAYYSNWE